MNIQINTLIKENKVPNLVLLCGSENYLKRQFKSKLIEHLLPGKDSMNLTFFVNKSGKKEESEGFEREIISVADTTPFFSDKRVIVCENTGFFKNKSEYISDYLNHVPESTYIIFVENDFNKNLKTSKTVFNNGFIEEYNKPDLSDLRAWVNGKVKARGKTIERDALHSFIKRTDISMDNMEMELNKLLSYCENNPVISDSDVEDICLTSLEEEVFAISNAISERNREKALKAYSDLYALKTDPRQILSLLNKNFREMLNFSIAFSGNMSASEIASVYKMKLYAVEMRLKASNRFSRKSLKKIVLQSQDLMQKMNTGLVNDRTGVEMFILQCLSY